MKKKILFYSFFLMIIAFQKSFSQKLNFTDLEYCLIHRIDESDTYLAKRGYEFMKYEEKKDTYSCANTEWAFARNTSNNRAASFISKYCDEPNEGFVWFQPVDKKAFEAIKTECLKLGFKFKSKIFETEVGALNFVYVTKKYKIEFASGINNDNTNVYSITLHKL